MSAVAAYVLLGLALGLAVSFVWARCRALPCPNCRSRYTHRAAWPKAAERESNVWRCRSCGHGWVHKSK